MRQSLNKVLLIGRIDAEPVVRLSPAGRSVASFGLQTWHSWIGPDGDQHEEHDVFNVVAWDHLAEFCGTRLAAGEQVYVEGRLRTRRWVDEQGRQHERTEVLAQEIMSLPAA